MAGIIEKIAALKEEAAKLEEERKAAFAEFGEKAFPKLKDKTEFADDVAKIEKIDEELNALSAEKEKLELEEKEKMAKLTCFSCKTVNPEDAAFCENCGMKLGEPPREYCEKCGTMNEPHMKFCFECGSKLED